MSIRITGLTKKFGAFTAVSHVSLDVGQGRMLVLLGPSGCGKTTIMRCIAGLEVPTTGRIEIGGRAVFDSEARVNVPVNQRNIGMVFQSYAIWPHMTVRENVAFPLEMKGLSAGEIRTQVDEVLALMGLSELAARGASLLSGGQMQRVALARSLVMRPAVLLFDEPLSNLDARLRDRLRVDLRELQSRFSITSVFVTHDQQEALALADEVAVIKAGTVLQRDNPVDVYRKPKSSTVAEFIGYQNVFPVEIEGSDAGGTRFRFDGQEPFRAAAPPPPGKDGIFACIRPDDIALAPAGEALPGPNSLRGEVTLASFMGPHMHYRVRLHGRDTVVEVFDRRIEGGMRIGSEVELTVPPEAVLLLPRSDK